MKKRRNKGRRVKKTPPSLLIAAFLVISGVIAGILLLLPSSPRTNGHGVRFEIFPTKPTPPPPTRHTKPRSRAYTLPLVSIIIDDMGYHKAIDLGFIRLEAAIACSFLPYGPFTKEYARVCHELKKDVLVHIPMEPRETGVRPGPGALYLQMSPKKMITTLRTDIRLVPFAKGANNHMGSRFTTNPQAMDIILLELKKNGFFFIDSRTTKDTVAFREAIKMGVPCLERHVFLDYSPKRDIIEQEIKRLVTLAKERGFAIGIGHPHTVTLKVLEKALPQIQKEVRIVAPSLLIKEGLKHTR